MGLKGIGYTPILIAGLVSVELFAAEPTCVTTAFHGMDIASEEAIREQLRNELSAPVATEAADASCYRLSIEMKGKTARISLTGDRVFETELNLDEVLPAHWPRAIALSSAGLLALSKNPLTETSQNAEETMVPDTFSPTSGHGETNPKITDPKLTQPDVTTSNKGNSRTEEKPAAKESDSKTTRFSPNDKKAPGRIRLHLQTGGRVIPKFWALAGEAIPGVGFQVGAFYLNVSVMGMWGRRSADLGKIYTAGVGLRMTAWWQALHRNSFLMRLGPAAEAIGVWGYGREAEGVKSHTVFAPVVDILLLIGGWFALTPRVDACIIIGGGWTALYFRMQGDGKDVSGLVGGVATLIAGIDFGI